MNAFTFVHAADLHLDAPFKGLTQDVHTTLLDTKKELATTLPQATFMALERLVAVCIEIKADFLVLAGDVYNSEQSTVKVHFALRDAFTTLQEHNIQVFLAHGNHDPLTHEHTIWPANVTVFGANVTEHTVMRGDSPLAIVHGISHTQTKENRNLATLFQRNSKTQKDILQIGVLHCAVQGAKGEHASYAPCAESDLIATNLDFLALGHVHSQKIFYKDQNQNIPFAAYSGSTQGLHINETGLHGCMVIQGNNNHINEPLFMPLAPVIWEQLEFDITPLAMDTIDTPHNASQAVAHTLAQLESFITPKLEELNARVQKHITATIANVQSQNMQNSLQVEDPTKHTIQHIVVRLILTGRSNLYPNLLSKSTLADVCTYINKELSHLPLFVQSIISQVKPSFDTETMKKRDDLVGITFQLTEEILKDENLLMAEEEALKALWAGKIRNNRYPFSASTKEELKDMVHNAHLMCLNELGVK